MPEANYGNRDAPLAPGGDAHQRGAASHRPGSHRLRRHHRFGASTRLHRRCAVLVGAVGPNRDGEKKSKRLTEIAFVQQSSLLVDTGMRTSGVVNSLDHTSSISRESWVAGQPNHPALLGAQDLYTCALMTL